MSIAMGGIWIFKHISCKRSHVHNGARKNRHVDTCVQTVPGGLLNLCKPLGFARLCAMAENMEKSHSDSIKKGTVRAVEPRTFFFFFCCEVTMLTAGPPRYSGVLFALICGGAHLVTKLIAFVKFNLRRGNHIITVIMA